MDLACFLTGTIPQRVFAEGVAPARSEGGGSGCGGHQPTNGRWVGRGHPLISPTETPAWPRSISRRLVVDVPRFWKTIARCRCMRTTSVAGTACSIRPKGHAEEVAAFLDAVASGGQMPIDLETTACRNPHHFPHRGESRVRRTVGAVVPLSAVPLPGLTQDTGPYWPLIVQSAPRTLSLMDRDRFSATAGCCGPDLLGLEVHRLPRVPVSGSALCIGLPLLNPNPRKSLS